MTCSSALLGPNAQRSGRVPCPSAQAAASAPLPLLQLLARPCPSCSRAWSITRRVKDNTVGGAALGHQNDLGRHGWH
eukprot:366341-Chlamydomonas_euryale.AAC.7